MRSRLLAMCVLPFLWFATACAAPLTLPADFVQLRDRGEGWRAITSDDARVRVRDLVDPTEGGVEFWAMTLRNDLVDQRGYEEVGNGEVKNQAGAVGRWFEFVANVQGERVSYLAVIWVVPPTLAWLGIGKPSLRVVEFAAKDAVFRARIDAVRAALPTVRG